MRRLLKGVTAALLALGTLTIPLAVAARDIPAASTHVTKNLRAIGYSARVVPTLNATPGSGVFNSDLAFWRSTAVQGTYAGFRLIDISTPSNPTEIVNWTQCASPTNTVGNQGDVIVWRNLVIRSWNSPTPAPRDAAGIEIPVTNPARFTTPGAFCGDWPMFREPAAPPLPERGQEGVHIIDISDPAHPKAVAFVDIPCGSHTETLVPDLANNRLLIYSNASANTTFGSPAPGEEPLNCRGIDIVEVPLANPAAAAYLRFLPSGDPAEPVTDHHACHDTAVILGDVMKAACSGGNSLTIWSLDPAEGGSLDSPKFMHHTEFADVSIGHTAAFTWDGRYAIFGHEPGGGGQAQCQATSSVTNRTLFFVDVATGTVAGSFLHPRPQTNLENCTWHNMNVVPTDTGYFLVSGNYQSGISVVDFSDPANAREIAYADPVPLVNPDVPASLELGGDWSTYWYNGFIYESDITRGLIVWAVDKKKAEADQEAAEDAFEADQKAAKKAFEADQKAAEKALEADLKLREQACKRIGSRIQRQQCLNQLEQTEQAFEALQKLDEQVFKAEQKSVEQAFRAVQKQDERDFKTLEKAFKTALKLDRLNPQTQEFSLARDRDDDDRDDDDDRGDSRRRRGDRD
jgi:LVIVD repeat-containing protein